MTPFGAIFWWSESFIVEVLRTKTLQQYLNLSFIASYMKTITQVKGHFAYFVHMTNMESSQPT